MTMSSNDPTPDKGSDLAEQKSESSPNQNYISAKSVVKEVNDLQYNESSLGRIDAFLAVQQ